MVRLVEPNRCAWKPCRNPIYGVLVNTYGTRQFCAIGCMQKYKETLNATKPEVGLPRTGYHAVRTLAHPSVLPVAHRTST